MAIRLKVLSYNIHKGFHWNGFNHTLESIRLALRRVNPDILCLQEVVGFKVKPFSQELVAGPQFEFLADEFWPHFAYGKNAVYDDGHHGNAILSKYPIKIWSNHDLSVSAMEYRGLLRADIQHPHYSRPITLLTTHLNLLASGRSRQYHLIENYLMSEPGFLKLHQPTILTGDFNDWTQTATTVMEHRLGFQEAFKVIQGDYAKTFPAFYPKLTLDRIYFHGLEVHRCSILRDKFWRHLSDHAALWVEFTLHEN